jgi:hypothetical protein
MRITIRRRVVTVVAAAACLLPAAGAAAGAASATAASVGRWHRPILIVDGHQSSNWSGYNQGTLEQNGTQFHSVSGKWRVPTATQHVAGEAEYSSAWVGIGGGCVDVDCTIGDTTLIQAGTEMDVNANGTASYGAWWEIIPEPATPIDMTIHLGDAMYVSINEDPAGSETWTILVKDLTSGKKFTTSTPYPSSYATVEWIVETPVVVDDQGNVTVGPLPSLATTKFRAARANGTSPHLVPSESIQLVDPNSGEVLATPSDPNPKGVRFNDCTYTSVCKAPR